MAQKEPTTNKFKVKTLDCKPWDQLDAHPAGAVPSAFGIFKARKITKRITKQLYVSLLRCNGFILWCAVNQAKNQPGNQLPTRNWVTGNFVT